MLACEVQSQSAFGHPAPAGQQEGQRELDALLQENDAGVGNRCCLEFRLPDSWPPPFHKKQGTKEPKGPDTLQGSTEPGIASQLKQLLAEAARARRAVWAPRMGSRQAVNLMTLGADVVQMPQIDLRVLTATEQLPEPKLSIDFSQLPPFETFTHSYGTVRAEPDVAEHAAETHTASKEALPAVPETPQSRGPFSSGAINTASLQKRLSFRSPSQGALLRSLHKTPGPSRLRAVSAASEPLHNWTPVEGIPERFQPPCTAEPPSTSARRRAVLAAYTPIEGVPERLVPPPTGAPAARNRAKPRSEASIALSAYTPVEGVPERRMRCSLTPHLQAAASHGAGSEAAPAEEQAAAGQAAHEAAQPSSDAQTAAAGAEPLDFLDKLASWREGRVFLLDPKFRLSMGSGATPRPADATPGTPFERTAAGPLPELPRSNAPLLGTPAGESPYVAGNPLPGLSVYRTTVRPALPNMSGYVSVASAAASPQSFLPRYGSEVGASTDGRSAGGAADGNSSDDDGNFDDGMAGGYEPDSPAEAMARVDREMPFLAAADAMPREQLPRWREATVQTGRSLQGTPAELRAAGMATMEEGIQTGLSLPRSAAREAAVAGRSEARDNSGKGEGQGLGSSSRSGLGSGRRATRSSGRRSGAAVEAEPQELQSSEQAERRAAGGAEPLLRAGGGAEENLDAGGAGSQDAGLPDDAAMQSQAEGGDHAGEPSGDEGAAAAPAREDELASGAEDASPARKRVRNSEANVRLKKMFNQRKSLAGQGLALDHGVRRSTRERHQPLQFWKNEHYKYNRTHQSLPTVAAIIETHTPDLKGEALGKRGKRAAAAASGPTDPPPAKPARSRGSRSTDARAAEQDSQDSAATASQRVPGGRKKQAVKPKAKRGRGL